MAKIAFLGLGVMGFPMAGHLASHGHELTVFNRTRSKADAWVDQHGGRAVDTPIDAAKGQDIVMCCVGNDDDLREVTLGDAGAFQNMQPDAVFVDHTTASAEIARELAAAASEAGFGFVDAPVSGGQAGAENGVLTVMCGGEPKDYEKVEPATMAFAQASRLMGPSGAGQLTKMVNQICIAGLVQGLSEGLAFAQNAGLDAKAVVDVISKGAAGSWQMSNRGHTMIDDKFDFGFAVDWMRKDLGICLSEAERNGSKLDIAELVDRYYSDIQAMGGGRWDTSSLIRRLR
ncbi:MAG: NAD(P)-dependent oxidoreductase [Pseudomonadota bacterium]